MSDYQAPISDMQFALNQIAELQQLAQDVGFDDATPDMVSAILEEANKLASQVLAPLNSIGDHEGARIDHQSQVTSPKGFADAYQQYVEGGWGGLQFPTEWEGQGLPFSLAVAVQEMWHSANMSWGLCPLLSQGAVEAIHANASEALKAQFLPKMVSGEWTGTMNLTEPQAGSDLSDLRTRAIPQGDHYLISGQKIFITWGDHDMAENVVHLVLARLPDAPAGVRGISLFLVPKFLVDAEGNLGQRNDCKAISLEEKMGIHGSPTCAMSFGDHGGAIGYLVGEENRGLACMFTMMNNARLTVGLQGVGLSERAWQQALAYSQERVQGTPPTSKERATIIHHPDVHRMLMTMKALTEAARALTYTGCVAVDWSHSEHDRAAYYQRRAGLLTPIIKGWATEVAQEVTSLNIQCHGGMGFIEETGAAQLARDARILPIYEGTNGIQAMDLVGRKTVFDQGVAMQELLAEMNRTLTDIETAGLVPARFIAAQRTAMEVLTNDFQHILHLAEQPNVLQAKAFPYLMLMGVILGGHYSLLGVHHAAQKSGNLSETFYEQKMQTGQFYLDHLLPRYLTYSAMLHAANDTLSSSLLIHS